MTAHPDAPRVDDELRRSVATLYALIDAQGIPAVSEACALMQLDRLVRRYPAAARMSLRLLRRLPHRPPPGLPGWLAVAAPDEEVPVWMRADGSVYVATQDADLLRFIAASLTRFDTMTAADLHAHLAGTSRPANGSADPGGGIVVPRRPIVPGEGGDLRWTDP